MTDAQRAHIERVRDRAYKIAWHEHSRLIEQGASDSPPFRMTQEIAKTLWEAYGRGDYDAQAEAELSEENADG